MNCVGVYIYDSMVDWEITFACSSLFDRNNGKKIVTIGETDRVITSSSCLKYLPDITVNEALDSTCLDGLIIPGGFERADSYELSDLIQNLNDESKLLSAICAGPVFLARAGVLRDKSYTTTLDREYFKSTDITDPFPRDNYSEKDLVVDKNIITAKYNAFMEFAVEIRSWFGLYENIQMKKSDLDPFKKIYL